MMSEREQYEEVECCVTSCVGAGRMVKSPGFKVTMGILHVISFILGLVGTVTGGLSFTWNIPPCTGNITGSIYINIYGKTELLELPSFLAFWAFDLTFLGFNFAILWAPKGCCYHAPSFLRALWFLFTIVQVATMVFNGNNYLMEIFPAWLEDTSACSHLIVVLSVIMVIAIATYGMMYATIAVIGVACNIVHKYKKQ